MIGHSKKELRVWGMAIDRILRPTYASYTRGNPCVQNPDTPGSCFERGSAWAPQIAGRLCSWAGSLAPGPGELSSTCHCAQGISDPGRWCQSSKLGQPPGSSGDAPLLFWTLSCSFLGCNIGNSKGTSRGCVQPPFGLSFESWHFRWRSSREQVSLQNNFKHKLQL